MQFAGIVFVLAFLGIVVLFAFKAWELRSQRVLAPTLRARADRRAQQLKELAIAARLDLAKLWPAAVRVSRIIVHEAALTFAALASGAERQAQRLADLVSHKHRFERRETRSEFLKKVAEHKSSVGLDATDDSVQNS